MPFNRSSHFYCEVYSSRASVEKVCSDARRGLAVVAAGEQGAVELVLRSEGFEESTTFGPRGGKKTQYRNIDNFEVWFKPWRSCDNPRASPILIATGPLDYDRVNHEQAMVRLDDRITELYRTLRAIEVMKK